MQRRTRADISFQELSDFESWEMEELDLDPEIALGEDLVSDACLWTDTDCDQYLSIEDLGDVPAPVELSM